MKNLIFSFFISCSLVLVISACTNSESYSNKLKAEEKTIQDYLNRNNITVINGSIPKDYKWGTNDYFLIKGVYYGVNIGNGFYFHLDDAGNTSVPSDTLQQLQKYAYRYYEYTLGNPPHTVGNHFSAVYDPFAKQYTLGVNASEMIAFHVSASLMKHVGARAKIIVPSKYGFVSNVSLVTPYGYTLLLQY